ncbi:MAG: ABC transporter ATP-binding protein/permease [Rhizobiales bacterium]|nr:ABC transporter ATP-binding protein/permease [Hyphomicrobiales bacterium]MBO6698703.1 ABC transporter ATP-binding protein/permease [Hyphomicrobiales bacterium]MBO6735044.1 ABC transporter ATP-binding protein/permease [Hyphomicrobiales bacterium]MBO6911150.1 ABC transporter ATP-binding protein/permease [Hyphomicrobiales bacterium]MBO6955660.1 ABC transporter ATP-binding protein/permease [Hyphomicrobiales bacterium]
MGDTLRVLFPYIWPHDRPDLKMRIYIALFILVLAKLVTVLVPYSYKWLTDSLTGELGAPASIPEWLIVPMMLVIAYGVGRLMMVGFNELRNALFAKVGQHAVRSLANETFNHIHRLSLRFHLQRRTGGLSRIIERGTKGIEIIIRFLILTAVPTLLEFALMIAVVTYQFDWTYAGIVIAIVVAFIWFTKVASDWRIAIRRAMNEADTDSNTKSVDAMLNYETVKYFNNEAMEARRFDGAMAKYEKAATQTFTSLATLNFGQTFIFTVGLVVCMIMSAQAVQAGTQTLGDFVMINALLLQLWQPMNFLGFVYREIKQGLVDLETMFDLLRQNPEVTDSSNAVPLQVNGGAICFEDVRFSYDPNRPILKGISFDVPAGKQVALVGPSGAGKSTISRLLYRFYDVSEGAITIDGQNLKEVTQASLRQQIGMVPQDTVLFNDTIAYNICYGRPSASEAEVREAARMAQIADFIEQLPDGFDTQVGERGLKLSGGEKQRVAIARTLLKAPPILILDEATSALDTQTEKEIQAALDVVSKDRTTLVIAHRLSTVIDADEIIVLKAGEIAERGTHDQLLAMNGLYTTMWNRQREASEAEKKLAETRAQDVEGVIDRGPRAGELSRA